MIDNNCTVYTIIIMRNNRTDRRINSLNACVCLLPRRCVSDGLTTGGVVTTIDRRAYLSRCTYIVIERNILASVFCFAHMQTPAGSYFVCLFFCVCVCVILYTIL